MPYRASNKRCTKPIKLRLFKHGICCSLFTEYLLHRSALRITSEQTRPSDNESSKTKRNRCQRHTVCKIQVQQQRLRGSPKSEQCLETMRQIKQKCTSAKRTLYTK